MRNDWDTDRHPIPTGPTGRTGGRLTRGLAWVAVACAGLVLGLGSLITTFGVGMSDPVWPTEPWYLATNGHVWLAEPARGFLIEHTHRLVAWGLGVAALALAVSAWRDEPNRGLRLFGLGSLALLIVGYLALHGEMRSAWESRKSGGGLEWPGASLAAVALGVCTLLSACLACWRSASVGRGVRLAASLVLIAVMAQGLLGGFRVFLHQLFGPQLAAVHGAFGQVTFALILTTAALAASPAALSARDRRPLAGLAWALLAACGLQLAWGVAVRHFADPVAQRLHIITASLVVGLAAAAAARILLFPTARRRLAFFAYHFLAVLAIQLTLGVEAYLGKFAVTGAAALIPVAERPVTLAAAAVRTGHTLVGAALLGSAAVFAVRVLAKPARRPVSPAAVGELIAV